MLRRLLPKGLKDRLRGVYKRTADWYVRWRYRFTKADLLQALRTVGIERGDVIFVHSAHSAFRAFEGKTPDIIDALKDAVGPEGTLLMPTFSVAGLAVDYAAQNKVFDPAVTPSQVGLITEIFRRSPGVERSLHPTHSVAGWGKRTAEFLRDNQLAATPCGRGTPLHRVLEAKGKIVLLGVDITTMSLFHTIEELLEAQMPFSPFTTETFRLRCRANGQLSDAGPMRLYAPDISRKRRLQPLAELLKKKGKWRQASTGNLLIISLQAQQVMETVQEMAHKGVFFYEGYYPEKLTAN